MKRQYCIFRYTSSPPRSRSSCCGNQCSGLGCVRTYLSPACLLIMISAFWECRMPPSAGQITTHDSRLDGVGRLVGAARAERVARASSASSTTVSHRTTVTGHGLCQGASCSASTSSTGAWASRPVIRACSESRRACRTISRVRCRCASANAAVIAGASTAASSRPSSTGPTAKGEWSCPRTTVTGQRAAPLTASATDPIST